MTPDMPFISMGSGKPSADLFLGFLRKVYWPTNPPTIQEGALAAYWTVQHAIDMKVLGVGFKVDVFSVMPSSKTFTARQLDETELTEHAGFIEASEETLRGMRKSMTAPTTESPIESPPSLKSQS
jgi:hypothetical protein